MGSASSPSDDDLLVEWECGVLRVRTDGQLVWQRQYPCWAYRDTIAEGVIWYEPNDATAAPNQQRWGTVSATECWFPLNQNSGRAARAAKRRFSGECA